MKTLTRDLRARSGRAPRQDFAKFVEQLPDPSRVLGLTHITSAYNLREIVEGGKLFSTEECSVLREKVIYAFYGRAAFRSSFEFVPTSLSSMFPSVLVLDPAKVPTPKYVFGFDSGAFHDGKMDQYLHPYMPVFDFLLMPNATSAARLIASAFANDDDFFQNRPRHDFTVPSGNFEAESYKSMLLSGGQGNTRLDDRLSTPELIFSESIDLRECVRAAVLPDSLASEEAIGGPLREAGVRIYEYPWTSCSRPGENHFTIQAIVRAAYGDLGWL